jgi:heterodisulfide reductase subunit A
VEAGRSPNIKIITNAEVQGVSGTAGDFLVTVLRRPRYVDESKCTSCGVCPQYCPVTIPDPYNQHISESQKKAIDILYTQAVPSAYSVHPDYCLFLSKQECKQCTRACQAGAINFDQKTEIESYNVGALIFSTGLREFNATGITAYGYKDSPNVVTGLEFERISSASGPFGGHIVRPSDLKKPQKIALVQCVGSRTTNNGNKYCSSVCCKYAVKDAIVALEHEPDLNITIFFMDMRTYGKDLEAFYIRAKQSGVKFIRSRVSEIKLDPETGDLTLKYVTEDGRLKHDTFNLVVLPMGLEAPKENFLLGKAASIDLNEYGFCKTDIFSALSTSRQGIFAAGGFNGPMALPEAVIQASGAAACSAELLAPARNTLIKKKSFPEEKDVTDEPLRVGVFVCKCGKNIDGVVDVADVTKYAATLPDVVMATDNLYSCSEDAQVQIKEVVKNEKLNRVVIASCTPRTHEPLFQETLRETGLNKCLIEMANIRDQCSWVHAQQPEKATQKAKDLVRMAVAKARVIEPLDEPLINVTPSSLIIGGGLAGMTAALTLADQGFECFLIEKTPALGGNLNNIHYTLEGNDPQAYLKELVGRVEKHKLIKVFTDTTVVNVQGFVGNFCTEIAGNNGSEEGKTELSHGTIILATGAEVYRPDEYLYGKSTRVLLQHELEQRLASGTYMPTDKDSVVMIQCVGSRDDNHTYCSSICCGIAIKNALKIKELNPNTNVYILYEDMRVYGLREDYYTLAREKDITFIRYEFDCKPVVTETENSLSIKVKDLLLNSDLVINASVLALSTAIVPQKNEVLDRVLPVPRSKDGFYLESHVQLKPVDSYIDGIYICGMSHFPKSIDESIAQARAAASKAAIPMARGYVRAEPIVASCDESKCIGCALCEEFCPYTAITVTKKEKRKKAEIIVAACKGCGVCASYCPTNAITSGRFTNEQIFAQIKAFSVSE